LGVYALQTKSKPRPQESEADKRKIEELLAMADKMENRIETLESILDKQDPNWRHGI
jgi:Phage shock protein B.